jgi:hypothetical protein
VDTWLEKLQKAKKDDGTIRHDLPAIPIPKEGSSIAIFIPKRGMGEGGKGSGWFAPPKGTHGPGSQGGKLTDDQFGSQIAQDANETAIVIYNGRESYRKEGDAVSVRFDASQRGQLKDCKIIHNHPNGSCLSAGDIKFAIQENLAEIQAVSHIDEKTFRRYRLVRGEGGWPLVGTMRGTIQLQGTFLKMEYDAKVGSGEMTEDEANELFWPELYEIVDDLVGCDFIEEVGYYD